MITFYVILFFIGLFQFMTAFIRLCVAGHGFLTYKKMLLRYLTSSILYLMSLRYILGDSANTTMVPFHFFVGFIPICIAIWYWRFMILHRRRKSRIKEFDKTYIPYSHRISEKLELKKQKEISLHQNIKTA